MKAEEKNIIYNLLKTSDSFINGFSSPKFLKTPVFSDDIDTQEPQQENKSSDQTADDSKLSIATLSAKIQRCTRCQLARTRTNVVPGMGVENPDVIVIGEGPGYDEDMQGLPFVGRAGILLDKMLGAIELSRKTNCYIANIVKCRPPHNRDPLPEEQNSCIGFLEAQISLLKPKMILCMGRVAGHKLLNNELPMNQLHGKFFSYKDIPLMITYHPSALLRDEALKRPAWDDLKGFKLKLDELRTK